MLNRASHVLEHRFDLLGSGPTDLGADIDWLQDFKSGRRWPLHHVSRIVISYPDQSDIKVPWELSRCQHLPLLAAAYRMTEEPRFIDEIGAQLISWIGANPVEFGVNWACTMDVAIRGANWVAALALAGPVLSSVSWIDEVIGGLLLHARFIRSHLESGSARGNHYLADVVGLLVLSAVFSGSDEGRGWALWATHELGREMRHQVRTDGCDHEASTAYHRLVTELFIVGADAAEALVPGRLDPAVRAGLDRMLAFVADYTRADGRAPQLGDADDGRFLPLRDYGLSDQSSHLHLFRQAGRVYQPSTRSAAYSDGGFYILRAGELYAAVRCGDVGLYGRGCHAHNDLLAFELSWSTTPLIIDPGSYLYTADPAARMRFRSTAVHSTLRIDGAEQNELREDRPFSMVDRAHATALAWDVASSATVFSGRHHGFEKLAHPATHTRTLRLDASKCELEILDEVTSGGPHELAWCFPLAQCVAEVVSSGVVKASFSAVTLFLQSEGLTATVEQDWVSPRYGVRTPTPFVRFTTRSNPGVHRTSIEIRVEESPQQG